MKFLVSHAAHIPPQCMYVNSFDLVSDKVIACFQCTDPCFMSAVVVVENYCVCRLSIVLLSDMRVIMPWISSNHFDKGFENRDAASTSGYHVTKNTCRREVWTPGNLRNSFKSVVKLHGMLECGTCTSWNYTWPSSLKYSLEAIRRRAWGPWQEGVFL